MKLKEITITKKCTINLGDYSNEVIEITLAAEIDQEGKISELDPTSEIGFLDHMVTTALIHSMSETVINRLIAGIPSLNGKVGDQRVNAIKAQPAWKVFYSFAPEQADAVAENVAKMSLAPERKAEATPNGADSGYPADPGDEK